MKIIPAIDIIEGKCVRLTKGDYSTQKIYSENPIEIARNFQDEGIKYLHVVDLEGAKAKHIVNYKSLEEITKYTNLKVDFGGGIKTPEDAKIAFDCGASQITLGSIAAKNPALTVELLEEYGNDKIILGADCLNRKISTNGWLEESDIEVLKYIKKYVEKGIKYTIVTDIEKDGMLQGPSIQLYKEIIQGTAVNLIASGGVTTLQDVKELKEIGCHGAIIGKAIYEGTINIKELIELC